MNVFAGTHSCERAPTASQASLGRLRRRAAGPRGHPRVVRAQAGSAAPSPQEEESPTGGIADCSPVHRVASFSSAVERPWLIGTIVVGDRILAPIDEFERHRQRGGVAARIPDAIPDHPPGGRALRCRGAAEEGALGVWPAREKRALVGLCRSPALRRISESGSDRACLKPTSPESSSVARRDRWRSSSNRHRTSSLRIVPPA